MNFKRFFLAVLLLVLLSSTAFATPGDRALKLGMSGDDVQYVQQLLTEAGYYTGAEDGVFGQGTQDAVQNFQVGNGLDADGVVGMSTLRYLMRSTDAEESRYGRAIAMTASAYSAYDPGNSNYTAQGHLVRKGIAAVDSSVIPLGTRLYIPGYGYAIADDTGGAIYGNRIDLAFDSHNEAINFGIQRVTVYILN